MSCPCLCDNCVNRQLCANQNKACEEFTKYVDTIPKSNKVEQPQWVLDELAKDGKRRVPTKAEYRKHFVL